MTEIERLRADLATLEKAWNIADVLGCPNISVDIKTICTLAQKKIADIEAQQPFDQWADAKNALYHWDVNEIEPDYVNKRMVFGYIRHLEAKVAELDHELRCERIDGGKVRDDRKAISAEKNREKLAELTTIANAIPPACGLARELVERRIQEVKEEMQGNG